MRYAKKAWHAGEIHHYIFGTPALLNLFIALLLVPSLALGAMRSPGLYPEPGRELGRTILEIVQYNFSRPAEDDEILANLGERRIPRTMD